MRKFRALLSVNLRALLYAFRSGKRTKSKLPAGAALALMSFLALYLSGTYSFMLGEQLAEIGMLSQLLLIMPAVSVLMGFLFTLFAAQGVIFGGKDNDLMLSLPISSFFLMLSRTLALYLENLIFSVFFMIPAGEACIIYGSGLGISFAVRLLICTVLLALLPTLLSLVCGFLMSWISTKFTRKALLSNILYFVFFALLMVGVFQFNTLLTDISQYAMGIQEGFNAWGLPFVLFMQGVFERSLSALLLFTAICTVPFVLMVWLFGRGYQRIVTGMTARGARNDYKLTGLSASGQRMALLKKESSRYFGTPIYLFNTGFGLIMLAGGGIAALLFRGKVEEVLREMGSFGEGFPMLSLLALAVCFLLSTVGITASSISLEGKQLWILKEAPVSVQSLFSVKIGFQMLLCLPCLLIGVTGASLGFGLTFGEGALLFGLGAAYAMCAAQLGLFINLCLPKLDAPNDTVVVKQSASVLVSMLACWLVAGAAVLAYVLLNGMLGEMTALLCGLVIFVICVLIMTGLLQSKGKQLYAELS